MGIRLDLSDEQRDVLVNVIESHLSSLHDEIAHTDTRDYREGLKVRRAFLQEVLGKLSDDVS